MYGLAIVLPAQRDVTRYSFIPVELTGFFECPFTTFQLPCSGIHFIQGITAVQAAILHYLLMVLTCRYSPADFCP